MLVITRQRVWVPTHMLLLARAIHAINKFFSLFMNGKQAFKGRPVKLDVFKTAQFKRDVISCSE